MYLYKVTPSLRLQNEFRNETKIKELMEELSKKVEDRQFTLHDFLICRAILSDITTENVEWISQKGTAEVIGSPFFKIIAEYLVGDKIKTIFQLLDSNIENLVKKDDA